MAGWAVHRGGGAEREGEGVGFGAPGGIRTPNRLIRSQVPYPFGHGRAGRTDQK
jgi:hypothetical protein